ncbi:hypothetical protein GQR58_014047 [Nymphon striatum]|nr:hypothetical protein GQR58_014047 [Nymphon striatum]
MAAPESFKGELRGRFKRKIKIKIKFFQQILNLYPKIIPVLPVEGYKSGPRNDPRERRTQIVDSRNLKDLVVPVATIPPYTSESGNQNFEVERNGCEPMDSSKNENFDKEPTKIPCKRGVDSNFTLLNENYETKEKEEAENKIKREQETEERRKIQERIEQSNQNEEVDVIPKWKVAQTYSQIITKIFSMEGSVICDVCICGDEAQEGTHKLQETTQVVCLQRTHDYVMLTNRNHRDFTLTSERQISENIHKDIQTYNCSEYCYTGEGRDLIEDVTCAEKGSANQLCANQRSNFHILRLSQIEYPELGLERQLYNMLGCTKSRNKIAIAAQLDKISEAEAEAEEEAEAEAEHIIDRKDLAEERTPKDTLEQFSVTQCTD